jgi:hypothetical protein
MKAMQRDTFAAAEAAVMALEGAGEKRPEEQGRLEREARRALREAEEAAAALVFVPAIAPIAGEVLQNLEFQLEMAPAGTQYATFVAEVHAAALPAYPELAAALRSPALLGRVRAQASNAARGPSPAEEGQAAEKRYRRAVAAQLAGAGGDAPAQFLGATAPALEARIDAATAAQRAAIDAARKEELASFFSEHAGHSFTMQPTMAELSGAHIARGLREGRVSLSDAELFLVSWERYVESFEAHRARVREAF